MIELLLQQQRTGWRLRFADLVNVEGRAADREGGGRREEGGGRREEGGGRREKEEGPPIFRVILALGARVVLSSAAGVGGGGGGGGGEV